MKTPEQIAILGEPKDPEATPKDIAVDFTLFCIVFFVVSMAIMIASGYVKITYLSDGH